MTIQTIYDQVLRNHVQPIVWQVYADKQEVVIAYWTWRIRRTADGRYHYLGEDIDQMRADLSTQPTLFAMVYEQAFLTIMQLNGDTNIF